jgi:hypothetical protein
MYSNLLKYGSSVQDVLQKESEGLANNICILKSVGLPVNKKANRILVSASAATHLFCLDVVQFRCANHAICNTSVWALGEYGQTGYNDFFSPQFATHTIIIQKRQQRRYR